MAERLTVRWFLVLLAVTTSACVPKARYRQPTASTLNAPGAPRIARSAQDLLAPQPTVPSLSAPPSPGPDERTVGGAWRWAGSEYRYIPPRNERKRASYTWERP